jgi:hypothetical protein
LLQCRHARSRYVYALVALAEWPLANENGRLCVKMIDVIGLLAPVTYFLCAGPAR